jgi:site-specific recombinase XerD
VITLTSPAPSAPIGPLLQSFFLEHLCAHKRVSPRTVESYRDTFRLLLEYVRDTTGKEPCSVQVADLDAPAVLAFLEHLEKERRNQAQSRNVRLAAVRSFFRVVALRDPASVGIAGRVLAIPAKRANKKLVGYLTRPEVDAVLAVHDLSQWSGRRDHALLLTLYNTGARISEVIGLERRQVSFGIKSFVQFAGKGRKERSVPLWPTTARTLQNWFHELNSSNPNGTIAFPSARGKALTRDGANYLLRAAARRAAIECASLVGKRIHPHLLRHTCAMHLLQSGVDITIIALWLGHERLQTTHGYIEADLATKERALQKFSPAGKIAPRFKADDAVLTFLAAL